MAKLIYVVEDDDDIRFIVEYILLESGYQVESLATAKEFREQLAAKKPELVILDVMLPDGNGIEICRNLKKNADTMQIPIVIMSAHAAEKSILEEACADNFISKPFDLDRLLQIVQQIAAP